MPEPGSVPQPENGESPREREQQDGGTACGGSPWQPAWRRVDDHCGGLVEAPRSRPGKQAADIAKKVKEDTGIVIEYIPVTTDDVSRRVITQPNSYDVVDTEYFSLKKLIPSGNLLPMDGKKIKNFEKITPVFS